MNLATEEELKNRVLERALPRHVAIIMDGNGRWAKQHGLPRFAGHREGVVSVRHATQVCGSLGIDFLTLYTFSSENWRRPEKEVNALMKLLVSTIRGEVAELVKNNVRLRVIGKLADLPRAAQRELQAAVDATAGSTGLNLILALSYGGRQEILDAIRQIASEVQTGALAIDEIDERLLTQHLYTSGIPDPDLLIRTSGEARLSNFLLWQLAYTELFITDALWPAFRERELYEAILVYQQRERRFGQVSEQLRK